MKKILKVIIFLVIVLLLYEVLGIMISYGRHPKVDESYQRAVDPKEYYGKGDSGERACIIEDNKEGLLVRLRLIEEAQKEIILSTFDFKSDQSGKDMQAALLGAAERGVKIKIVVDGFSALTHMRDDYFSALSSNPNVEFRAYNIPNPLFPWKTMGRMHDKYLMIDRNSYLLGGRNTYDYFLGGKGYQNYDRDVFVYRNADKKKEGSADILYKYFQKVWKEKECRDFRGDRGKKLKTQRADKELQKRYQNLEKRHPELKKPWHPEKMTYEVSKISILVNPTHVYTKKPELFYTLTELMKGAKEEVKIHTPYVICGKDMYKGLANVCEKVEQVSMMTNSVANNGNPFGASDYALHKEELLKTGLTIYEYEGGISYHGKSVTIDDDLAIVGSFNMDMRSAYLDTEIMLVVHSKGVTAQLKDYMASYEKQSAKVLNEQEVSLPKGVERQRISKKRKMRVQLLKPFNWLRFLM